MRELLRAGSGPGRRGDLQAADEEPEGQNQLEEAQGHVEGPEAHGFLEGGVQDEGEGAEGRPGGGQQPGQGEAPGDVAGTKPQRARHRRAQAPEQEAEVVLLEAGAEEVAGQGLHPGRLQGRQEGVGAQQPQGLEQVEGHADPGEGVHRPPGRRQEGIGAVDGLKDGVERHRQRQQGRAVDQVERDAEPEEARVGEEVPGRLRRVPRHHQPVLDGEVGIDHQRPAHQQRHPRQPGSLLLGSIGKRVSHGGSFGDVKAGYDTGTATGDQKIAKRGAPHPHRHRDMGRETPRQEHR